MRNAGLEETQAGIKISWRNINNLRYADDTTLREVEGGRNVAMWWPATTSTGVCGSAELGATDRASGGPRPGLGWCGR